MSARVLIGLAILLAVGAGVYVLRENTMSNERADSVVDVQLVVEFDVHTQGMPSHELPLVATSIFNACRLQAEAGLARPVRRVDQERFRAVLTPAPNETDRNQLAGCLSDVGIAHVRTGDVAMRTRPAGDAS